jgi:hypothetical protein
MTFGYYRRLSKRDKAVYRKSDSITKVELPDPRALGPAVRGIFAALAADDRSEVERAAIALVAGIGRQLSVRRVSVRVLAVRPSSSREELHGLYVRDDDGSLPVIHVWMRTAAKRRVVSPRTFLRTLLHEVCHHLDYELHALSDSFHTEGFFKRESSLMRQLVPTEGPRAQPKRARPERSRPVQLDLGL